MPPFASETFRQWFLRRPRRNAGRPRVILWADTFNNHFFPDTAQAAVDVLEAAGQEVIVPRIPLCCGRPLYDFGMLSLAKSLLRQILDTLRPEIEAGTPVVCLEPSCTAVFRDELINLFPHDWDARRLARQTFTLAEFLGNVPGYQPAALHRQAVVHGHCHQKAIMKMESERRLYDAMGLQWNLLDSGCCGMAGSFGFKTECYGVSQQVGNLTLLPAVRRTSPDTIIIADGFSCREQIAQATPRQALHTAEVLRMAMDKEIREDDTMYAEMPVADRRRRLVAASQQRALAVVLLAGGAAFVTGWAWKRWSRENG